MLLFILFVAVATYFIGFRFGINRIENRRRKEKCTIQRLTSISGQLKADVSSFIASKTKLETTVSELSVKEKSLTDAVRSLDQYVVSEKAKRLSELEAEIICLKKDATNKIVSWAEEEERRINAKLQAQIKTTTQRARAAAVAAIGTKLDVLQQVIESSLNHNQDANGDTIGCVSEKLSAIRSQLQSII
ncbi:hypothetical protein CCP1ISM_40006 [Azospirillaceae bacterium]